MYTKMILESAHPVIIEQILEDSVYTACIQDNSLCNHFLNYADLLESDTHEPSEEFEGYLSEVLYPYFESASAIYESILFEVEFTKDQKEMINGAFKKFREAPTEPEPLHLKQEREKQAKKDAKRKQTIDKIDAENNKKKGFFSKLKDAYKRHGKGVGLVKNITGHAAAAAGGAGLGLSGLAPAVLGGTSVAGAIHGAVKGKKGSKLKSSWQGTKDGFMAPINTIARGAAHVGNAVGGIANKIRKGVNRAKHAIDVKRANVTGKKSLGAKLFGFRDKGKGENRVTASDRVKRVVKKQERYNRMKQRGKK